MRHYLDHAASSPLRPSALTAMTSAASAVGNPSSTHTAGRRARGVLEDAREQLADAVGAHPSEVVFTSGGTEADRLVVQGGAAWGRAHGRPRVAASTVEHPAVLDAVRGLGADALWLGVDADGVLDQGALAALDETVSWVSVMGVSNETGALQPLDAVVAAARARGVRVHSDAVQTLGHVPLDVAASGLDAVTVSAHKVGGPVGVGALIARRDAPLAPVSPGGGQERELRSGTVPVMLAAGFAAAAAEAVAERADVAARHRAWRDRVLAAALACGGRPTTGAPASAHLAHVAWPDCRADDLLLLLDAAGLDCSTGSACRAGVHRPSEVLLAMGWGEDAASGALRFSFGWSTTEADVDALVAALPDAVARARAAA